MEQITDGSYHSSDHEEGAREEKEEDVRTSKVHVSDCKYVFVFAVSLLLGHWYEIMALYYVK